MQLPTNYSLASITTIHLFATWTWPKFLYPTHDLTWLKLVWPRFLWLQIWYIDYILLFQYLPFPIHNLLIRFCQYCWYVFYWEVKVMWCCCSMFSLVTVNTKHFDSQYSSEYHKMYILKIRFHYTWFWNQYCVKFYHYLLLNRWILG